jgi:hypothetical protein
LIDRLKQFRIKPSNLAIIFIIASAFFMTYRYDNWRRERGMIDFDVISYYSYLPATFIYHDVSLRFMNNYKGAHQFTFWPSTTPDGKYYIKTSMGPALCYAPFFFGGHLYANLFHYDTGGYSRPYHIALLLSALFFAFMGLFFLRKTLQNYFNDEIIAIVLLLTVFASNLFYYITIEGSMSHCYSFALISAFIFYSIKWHTSSLPKYKTTVALGLLLGWIGLIRPTNLLIFLFFILYDVKNFHEAAIRIKKLLGKYQHLLLIGFFVIIFWIPQMMYWKHVTGQWFFFSYGDERFYFLKPHLAEGLFGFRKGWFVYTPIMLFAIAGLLMSFKNLKPMFFPVLIFLSVHLWVTLSWWCWWYGGSFGLRALVDIYALMAIPLAVFVNWFWQNKYMIKFPFAIIFLALVLLNSFNTIQYMHGGIHYDSMTKAAYFENFGHIEPNGNYLNLLQQPDYKQAVKGIDAVAE